MFDIMVRQQLITKILVQKRDCAMFSKLHTKCYDTDRDHCKKYLKNSKTFMKKNDLKRTCTIFEGRSILGYF